MSLTITVKSLTGNSVTLEMVDSDTTVGDFKIAVCAAFSGYIIPCKQRLILNGKQLEDQRTLDSYELQAPILIHLVIRLAGGCYWLPEVGTTFPHQAKLRNICVNGKHWWDITAPEPRVARFHNWFPETIHGDPAPIELYRRFLNEIRDTPLSMEQVGHRILTEYGYVKQPNEYYYLPEDKRPKKEFEVDVDDLVAAAMAWNSVSKEQALTDLVRAALVTWKPNQPLCEGFGEVMCVEVRDNFSERNVCVVKVLDPK